MRLDRDAGAAHRVAALAADGHDARSPGCSVISRAAKRIVFVFSGPARPRSVVISTIRRLPPSRSAEQRVVLAAQDGGEVGEDLVELLAVRPRGERRVLGALQLRRGHELHRPGDLLDVPDGADPPPDIALASHCEPSTRGARTRARTRRSASAARLDGDVAAARLRSAAASGSTRAQRRVAQAVGRPGCGLRWQARKTSRNARSLRREPGELVGERLRLAELLEDAGRSVSRKR